MIIRAHVYAWALLFRERRNMLLKSDSVMTINALDCGLLNEIITSDGRKTYDRKPFTDVLSLFEKSNKEHLVIQCDPEKNRNY